MQYAYGFVQTSVESYGELSFESAQAYYEYGNALLTKEEENPSNQILNNVEDENDDAEDENEDNDNDDEGEKQQESDAIKKYVEDEPEGDFQIAWESLDVVIFLFFISVLSFYLRPFIITDGSSNPSKIHFRSRK